MDNVRQPVPQASDIIKAFNRELAWVKVILG